MLKRVIPFLLVALIAGCGYNPESPVYDTAKNPDDFPQQALQLLNNIEDTTWTSYDKITGAFADLYTEHSELLDNDDWRHVIDRLGEKFRYRADQYMERGPAGYTQAAAYFQLASFARPSDKKAHEAARLFSTWSDMVEDSILTYRFTTDSHGPTVEQKVRLLRHFELGDSLHQSFADKYLKYQLFEGMLSGRRLPDSITGRLPDADQVFLSYEGLASDYSPDILARFQNPSIDLLAANLVPLKPGWYRVELYFLPKQKLPRNYTIAVRVPVNDTAAVADSTGFLPFDFEPVEPMVEWPMDQVKAVAKQIYVETPPSEIRVGLYERPSSPTKFVKIEGTDQSLVTLTVSTILDN